MSYKRYPKYKDSGVDWIGDVPEHWDAVRITRLGVWIKASGGSKEDASGRHRAAGASAGKQILRSL